MPLPRVRFTIGGLMIAVVVIAGLLALPDGWREFAAVLTIPVLALFAARWLFLQRHRRLVGFCFWVLAIAANVGFVAFCVTPGWCIPELLCAVWLFLLLPPLAGFGGVWLVLLTRDVAAAQGNPLVVRVLVVVLTVLPLVTVLTLWPLQIAFHLARPSLETLADRVAAGQSVKYPVWAGPFRIADSVVDPGSGNIGLMIDPNRNGPTGFVRHRNRSFARGCASPFVGDMVHVSLTMDWCYHVAD
jgi:hypothetical protein